MHLVACNPRRRRVSGLGGWNSKNVPELIPFRKSEVRGGTRVQGKDLGRGTGQKQVTGRQAFKTCREWASERAEGRWMAAP